MFVNVYAGGRGLVFIKVMNSLFAPYSYYLDD